MLQTAAFRLPPDLLGELWVYPTPARFHAEFENLKRRWSSKDGLAAVPYASLANALSAVTGRPVRILPRTRPEDGEYLLVTTEPIEPGILHMAVSTWERLCRGSASGVLASLLDGVTPRPEPLAKAIRDAAPGRVDAEPWIYRVLGWTVARRLAQRPVSFDGRVVPFRVDSSGTLVAWDDPIVRQRRGRAPARALMRITPHIRTLPGCGDLVCLLDIGLVRLQETLYDVRYAWIDHGRDHGGNALLKLRVGKKTKALTDFSKEIVEECGLDTLPWGKDVLREHPDRVRAGRATNAEHRIGTGVGPRTYLRVTEHAAAILGTEPVAYAPFTVPGRSGRPVAVRVGKPCGDPLAPEALDSAIAAAGHRRLRIVHLTGASETRRRIREELDDYRDPSFPALLPKLGVAQRLTGGAEVVGYDVKDLLRHGTIDRSALVSRAPLLEAEDGMLVLALVETEYDTDGEPPDPDHDAKPDLRRQLAQLGVASQFLRTKELEEGTDHPVRAALKDLMRAGGFTDGRLAVATTKEPCPLDRPAWLVGIHVRRQNSTNSNGRSGRPRLVSTMVALHAHPDGSTPWTVYFYVPGRGWLPHALGLAAFHAGPIGPEIRRAATDYANLRDRVGQALATLPGPEDEPIVVMVDADATRRVWAGLSDARLGAGPLPGQGLPAETDITVVRVSAADTATPRPVHRTAGGKRPGDPRQPATPGSQIYVRTGDDGTRIWLLGRTSRTFAADATGRVGAAYTRFTLPAEKTSLQGKPWHSFTGTEIVVVTPGAFSEDQAAALTARLCAQPFSWDGLTRWPVPLHLARKADEDHPSLPQEEPDSVGEHE